MSDTEIAGTSEAYEKLQELAQLVVAPKVYILQYLSQYF